MFSDLGLRQSIVQSRRGAEPAFLNTAWALQILRGLALWLIALAIALGVYLADHAGMVAATSVYADPSLPWVIAALASWGIALFEYLVQVPANRIGYTTMSLGQLKVMQEVITLAVFVPFALFYMKQPLKLDFLWAGLCLVAAAYFIFRND